ncbi:hypothetical protein HJFPF1_07351 [Paramyrothecium foliicola]|nr:hypothetical protein HJFPF1_07351 [Paramyrothecium foliicola]
MFREYQAPPAAPAAGQVSLVLVLGFIWAALLSLTIRDDLLPMDAGNGGEGQPNEAEVEPDERPIPGGGEVLTEGPDDLRWGEGRTFELGQ